MLTVQGLGLPTFLIIVIRISQIKTKYVLFVFRMSKPDKNVPS